MTSYLLAGPAEEPVSLVRAKAFLRVDDAAEDGLIEALITAARIHLESTTGRALMAQSWRVVRDCWPENRVIALPVSPLIALSEVRAFDAEGNATVIDTAQFLPDGQAVPARLILPANIEGAPVLRERMGIEIDYVAGFGTEPADVPGDLIQALLTLVAYWYEHRDAVLVAGAGSMVPAGFDRLVANYKRVRL
ncbi:head-tail connector protein [Pelagibacterium xiamenense]|uniref:head-tail connector protein n=1 Tax=Pelagibacterium xiamenense TaxID=2901140 RepID=UPI001E6245AB|nr:phage head-tail connector protein [Pelagibacterium xiamenense]MCD7059489.1 phage head-tail connector protein [Pelagibacterium xiamenense]